jgi:hypothetical protein
MIIEPSELPTGLSSEPRCWKPAQENCNATACRAPAVEPLLIELSCCHCYEDQHVREKMTCRDCEKISEPPAPFHVVPRGCADPNLLAMFLFEKFGQHCRASIKVRTRIASSRNVPERANAEFGDQSVSSWFRR